MSLVYKTLKFSGLIHMYFSLFAEISPYIDGSNLKNHLLTISMIKIF